MKRWISKTVGWIIGLVAMSVRATCRVRLVGDPRAELSRRQLNHVFAVFHAHQLAGLAAAEPGTATMVSRSDDGEIVVPLIRLGGHVPIRGSSGAGRKGGGSALKAITRHVRGGKSAILTVDGPRGPRGHVQKGIGLLAKTSGAAVICAVAVPNRRWILTSTWDRLQIPKPFCQITVGMAPPLELQPGESLDAFAQRVRECLHELEQRFDPTEAATNPPATSARRAAA